MTVVTSYFLHKGFGEGYYGPWFIWPMSLVTTLTVLPFNFAFSRVHTLFYINVYVDIRFLLAMLKKILGILDQRVTVSITF
jgi:hypothetical protein